MAGGSHPRRTLAVGFGLAAAAAAVVLLAHNWNQRLPSLGFRIVDEAGVPHATPDLDSAGRIEFSDGSKVTVATQTRASVTAIDALGARIRAVQTIGGGVEVYVQYVEQVLARLLLVCRDLR